MDEKLKKLLLEIPKGKVTTYKILADLLNLHPRKIGKMLSSNNNKKIPCYKVVHSDGKIGGYVFGGSKEKERLLKKEGIIVKRGKIKYLERFLYRFNKKTK